MSPQHDGPATRSALKTVSTKGKSAFEPLNGEDGLADPPKLRNTAVIGAVDPFAPTGCKAPSPFTVAAQCEPIMAGRVGTAISAASRGIDSTTPPPIDADYPSATPVGAFGTSLSPSDAQLHEPSVCIPWVSPEVGREVIVSTFEQFGTVKQVDLVPREDHFLCFVHFDKWNVEDAAVNAVRVRLGRVCSALACFSIIIDDDPVRPCDQMRLLNPPSMDYKESVEYAHPVTGQQRWLFSRSRVPPRVAGTKSVTPSVDPANPYGLGVVGITVPVGSTRLGNSTRPPSCPPPPTSAAFVAPNEPSLCVPWVRQNVTRELLQETFTPFGTVKQVDLVPKGDHYLCFIHFHAWKLEDPVACAVRVRILLWSVAGPSHRC